MENYCKPVAGLANHRLDPPLCGVTALAQSRKRRATGRAGQAERYANRKVACTKSR